MKTKYTYDLRCPCCERDTLIATDSRVPLPTIFCPECITDIMVELDIVRVYVDDVPVDGQDTVSLFHRLNEQRIPA